MGSDIETAEIITDNSGDILAQIQQRQNLLEQRLDTIQESLCSITDAATRLVDTCTQQNARLDVHEKMHVDAAKVIQGLVQRGGGRPALPGA